MIRDRFKSALSNFGVTLVATGSLLALSIGSARAEAPQPDEPLEFSHSLHVGDEEMDCTDCHDPSVKVGLPTLKPDTCTDCHDERPVVKLAAPSRRLRARFPHAEHVKALQCAACHKPVIEEHQEAGEPLVTEERCVECHEHTKPRPKIGGCVACHGRNERLFAPADHKRQSWLWRHGRAADLREFDGIHGQECSTCHRPSDCRACHSTQRPRSHTALWRARGHGQAALWDRDTCKTCHETGSCAGCHARTEPMNHRGAWIATHGLAAQTRDRDRCLTCHRAASCAACHQGVNR